MKILTIADLHLGHLRTPASYIARNIKKYVFPRIPDVDIVFIAGDIFDLSVGLNSNNACVILALFDELFDICNVNNAKLRLLKGTHYHDKNQIKSLLSLAINTNLDIKYFDSPSLEYIQDLDIYVYYLPDNLPYTLSDLLKKMENDFKLNHIQKVDILVCHGTFDFANVPHEFIYPYEVMSKYVSKYMLLGHIHQAMKYKKAFYSGSFDMLTHGDNTSKGFFIIDTDNKEKPYEFIRNENQLPYHTFEITKETERNLLSKLDKFIVEHFPKDLELGYLRCKIPVYFINQYKRLITKYVKNKYPNIIPSFITTNYDEVQVFHKQIKEPIDSKKVLTDKSLIDLTYKYIKKKYPNVTKDIIKKYLK